MTKKKKLMTKNPKEEQKKRFEEKELTKDEIKNLTNNELFLLHGMVHREYKKSYADELWYLHADIVEELASRRIKHFDRSLIDSTPTENLENIIETYRNPNELVDNLFKRKKEYLME